MLGAISVTRTSPPGEITNLNATPCTTVGDLTDGTTYYYRVKSGDIAGLDTLEGNASREVSAVADANGCIKLNWTAAIRANTYLIWRTPISGNYTLVFNAGGDMDRDKHSMFLRNGLNYFTNRRTTLVTNLTDIGTTTEEPAAQGNYRAYMNYKLRNWSLGLITVSGGTDGGGEASFNDIYLADQANGWNQFLLRYSDNEFLLGHRVFESRDKITINNFFKERDFVLYHHDDIRMNNDGDLKTFGRVETNGNMTWGNSQFVSVAPAGRQYDPDILMQGGRFYGVKFLRNFGEIDNVALGGAQQPSSFYLTSASMTSQDDNAYINVVKDNNDQNWVLSGTDLKFNNVDLNRNARGFNIAVQPTDSFFNNIRYRDNSFELTNTVKGLVFSNPFYFNFISIFRYFGAAAINDSVTIINPTFGAGFNLPASASQGGGAIGSIVVVNYTFEMKVIDNNFNSLNNANVQIADVFGNTKTLTTDSEGVIAKQVLQRAVYSRATDDIGVFDTTVSSNPHTITVSASDFTTKVFVFNITDSTNWIVALNQDERISASILVDGGAAIMVKQR